MKKSTRRLAAAVTAMTLIASACGSDDAAEPEATDPPSTEATEDTTSDSSPAAGGLPESCSDDTPVVGVMVPNTTNPYYTFMIDGFEEAAAANGFEVEIAVANDDVNAQLGQADSFVQQGVCAVALNAISSGPGAAMAATISDAGIPVFTVNVTVDADQLAELGGSVVQYIGADQVGGGELIAEQVLADLGSDAAITAGIVGFPAAEVTNQRDEGFTRVLESGNPNAQVVQTVDGEVVPDVSLRVTTEMLQGNPDMNLIFADTGPATAGALQAIEQLGVADTVRLYGFCATDLPVESPYYACVAQDPAGYATLVIENIRLYVDGAEVPEEILEPTPLFVEGETPPEGLIG